MVKASAPSTAAVNSGNEVAFLKFEFPKPTVYDGESAVGRLELYLRNDVQNFGNFQLTGSPTDGFNSGKPVELQNQRRRVQVGNHSYTVIPLAVPLTAIRTGQLTLGPFTATAVVVLPSRDQGGDPFFRQFFNQGEQKQVSLASEPVTVESLPLPEAGKPAKFNGAVGDFTMTVTAGPTNVTVGDPITLRVQISGRGALDAVTLPPQASWNDFETYPPTTKLETSDQFCFQGTKTFEQIVSPKNSDVHELPSFSFSFFNPADDQYHTLTGICRAVDRPSRRHLTNADAGGRIMFPLQKTSRRTFCPSSKTWARSSQNRLPSWHGRYFSPCKPCRCSRFWRRSSGASERTISQTIHGCAANGLLLN